jgi:alkylation response protein AidB-like acyl-CoA dehydrogenase
MNGQPTATHAARVIQSSDEARDVARALARSWAKTAAAIDAERAVPWHELAELSRSGLLAITVPRAHGGPELPTTTVVDVFRILAAADVALAQIPQNHFDFVDTLANAPRETQRAFYAEVLRGARFGNAIAEPGRKSRRDLATTIVEDGDGYRINGTKYFCTGALTADWVPVLALHGDGRIRTAYLSRRTPGLDVRGDWDAFGQRATFSGTTVITDVWVPKENVVNRSLGHPGFLLAQFAGNQLIHAAIETGGAEGALAAAAELVRERSAGRAASTRDLARLGELDLSVRAARALVDRAARLVDVALAAVTPSRDTAVAAAIAVDEAKSVAYALGPAVANQLIHFGTPAAADRTRGLDRYWRNTRTHSLHDPVRWRQAFVGDFHLNGRIAAEIALRFAPAPVLP